MKAEFTSKLGDALALDPRTGVKELIYSRSDKGESVLIIFHGGLTKIVDVTADSPLAIAKDVIKEIE